MNGFIVTGTAVWIIFVISAIVVGFMSDFIFVGSIVFFFVVGALYVRFCDRL